MYPNDTTPNRQPSWMRLLSSSPSVDSRSDGVTHSLRRAQPLLEHRQAEEQLVVVLAAGRGARRAAVDAVGSRKRTSATAGRAAAPADAPSTDEWNQSSTTLTAKPRFLRLRISGGRYAAQTCGAATSVRRAESSSPRRGAGRTPRRCGPGTARGLRGRAPSRACRRTSAVRRAATSGSREAGSRRARRGAPSAAQSSPSSRPSRARSLAGSTSSRNRPSMVRRGASENTCW